MALQRIDLGLRDVTADAGCCGGDACGWQPTTAASAGDAPVTTELRVDGMTCAHCVRAVADELARVDGVDAVEVDLVPEGVSRVHVRSATTLDASALAAAIAEAGYTLRA
ncbi:MAG: cation transporter [Microbacterium sp.]|uniref:heavy-metal-associated domain-containing protein n=1 Tax=Microbacterium sp. TaxID=51671 RepID=UPI0039E3B8BA